MTPKKKRMPDWAPKFFDQLRQSPCVTHAAELAGVSKQRAYQVRAENPDFAAGWDDALDSGVEFLEAAAFERAKGQSDTLLIFLLKSHKPEKYREQIQHTHGGKVTLVWTDDQNKGEAEGE